MNTDPHNLNRFIRAQNEGGMYKRALAELIAGKKTGHWIWFVLPRLIGPDYSTMSVYYAMPNRWAARAYLQHPILGPRLLRCVEAILAARGTLLDIFGSVDALKVRQCTELFASVATTDASLFLHLLCKP